MKRYSLYDFPELYNSLRTPDKHTFGQVYELIIQHLGRKPGTVMDPACGPGTWLEHFAKHNIQVAGNDICPEMIKSAGEKCKNLAIELLIGDMCDLKFKKSPFDVILEIAGTCGCLSDEYEFRRFLKNVINHTSVGGLILLTIFFVEELDCNDLPVLVDKWGPVDVDPNGRAWISYEVVGSEPSRSVDYVRRTVHTHGIEGCTEPLVDEYEMFSWDQHDFWNMVSDFPQLEYLTAFKQDDPTGISISDKNDLNGETTVIFKRCK